MTTAEAPPSTDCPRCGAPLRPDQDWCLNCGTAVTTEIAGAPGWRTPVAIVAAVLLIAAGALIYAFLQISGDADQVAQATPQPAATPAAPAAPAAPAPTASPSAEPTASASPVPPPPANAPTPAAGAGAGASPTPGAPAATVATWPTGRTAWTVVLFSSTRKEEADAKAKGFAGQGKPVGVLDSNGYPSLRAGYWVVFSGQYDTQDQAQSAAEAFGDSAPGAYAREVKPK